MAKKLKKQIDIVKLLKKNYLSMVFQYLKNQCGIITTLKQENGKKGNNMANPNFLNLFLSLKRHIIFYVFKKGKITDADLTISKTIESLAKKESKRHGYKNGKA